MRLKLRVENEDGSSNEVLVRPRTQVAFERHFSTPDNPVRLDQGVSMEQMYWLAWHALKIGVAYDQWLDTIDEVTPIVENDEEVDGPLDTGRHSGTSLQPPSSQDTASRSTS